MSDCAIKQMKMYYDIFTRLENIIIRRPETSITDVIFELGGWYFAFSPMMKDLLNQISDEQFGEIVEEYNRKLAKEHEITLNELYEIRRQRESEYNDRFHQRFVDALEEDTN